MVTPTKPREAVEVCRPRRSIRSPCGPLTVYKTRNNRTCLICPICSWKSVMMEISFSPRGMCPCATLHRLCFEKFSVNLYCFNSLPCQLLFFIATIDTERNFFFFCFYYKTTFCKVVVIVRSSLRFFYSSLSKMNYLNISS